jgi:Ni,Fe-hydrogenase III large subunit
VDSYGFYKNLKIKYLNNEQQMETEERLSGDVYLRLQSVIFQARQSFRLVREMLDALPEGPYLQQVEVRTLPDGFWTAGVEAPTGPMYAAISEGAIRLASTSTRMAGVMDKLLEGVHEQDLNLAIASLGYDPMQGDLS